MRIFSQFTPDTTPVNWNERIEPEKIKKEKAYALKLKRDLTKLRKQLKHSQKEISTKLVTKPKRKKPKKKRRK